MSQLTLVATGDPIDSVRLDADPDLTIGPDDVLVDMEAATINPSDFLYASGYYGVQAVLERGLGSEGVGRVTEVGTNVDSALKGARVVILANLEQGTWAHQSVVPAHNVVRVGETADAAQLAQLSVNPVTAHVLLSRYGDLELGSWIGQTMGNGAVGQFVTKLARHAGYKTLSIVRSEKAAAQVRAAGGDIVLIAGDNLPARIAEALDGQELALVIDGEGGGNVGALASSLKFGGPVVAYSAFGGALPEIGISDLILREVQLSGWWLVNWIRNASRAEIEATYADLEALVNTGVIDSPVEAQYRLDQYREAFEHATRTGRSGKILFDLKH